MRLIDITKEISHFVNSPEWFEKKGSKLEELTGESFKQDSKTLSKHVSYSLKKKVPTLALTQDAFACDE